MTARGERYIRSVKSSLDQAFWKGLLMPPPLDLPASVRITCIKPDTSYKRGARVRYVGPDTMSHNICGTVLHGQGDWRFVLWDVSVAGFKGGTTYIGHLAPASV